MFRTKTEIIAARAVLVDGLTVAQASKREGIPRTTLNKALGRVTRDLQIMSISNEPGDKLRDLVQHLLDRVSIVAA